MLARASHHVAAAHAPGVSCMRQHVCSGATKLQLELPSMLLQLRPKQLRQSQLAHFSHIAPICRTSRTSPLPASCSPARLRLPYFHPRIGAVAAFTATTCSASRHSRTTLPPQSPSLLQSSFNRSRRKDLRWKSTGPPQRQVTHSPPPATPSNPKSSPSQNTPHPPLPESPDTPSTPNSRNLLDRIPDLSQRFHRPTKEELLAAANGFWSRLRVRFKWFSIRSLRPFNVDDISAFFSWVLLGHLVWIILGTTTFFSLIVFSVNTVFAQETLAGWIGNYLTKSVGVKVVFESAIVPNWRDGVITFKNVFVSRRPGQKKGSVTKGSSASAAAAAAPFAVREAEADEAEDSNYTQYDVSIETVNVTLSFAKWFNGKGLLRDVDIEGIRGVVDRTSVHFGQGYVDPRIYKHEHHTGDFELESFRMKDLLVSIYQPGGFRPFSVSIFSADLPQLRKQWLFYDFLNANVMSGTFDGSPFFVHPRQTHNYTGATLRADVDSGDPTHWKKHTRIRIDGLNIDHLNTGVEGPFSWITSGNVDIVADMMIPNDNDDSIAKVMSDFYDRMEATVANTMHSGDNNVPRATSSSTPPSTDEAAAAAADNRFLILDLRVHLNDVHATVPLFPRELSYVNNALIRPIVAYINSRRGAFIPINCRVVKRVAEFDGSWTLHDSGLMEDLSKETYDAFVGDIVDDSARMRRFKKVGLWSLQLAVQALFLGLAGNIA